MVNIYCSSENNIAVVYFEVVEVSLRANVKVLVKSVMQREGYLGEEIEGVYDQALG